MGRRHAENSYGDINTMQIKILKTISEKSSDQSHTQPKKDYSPKPMRYLKSLDDRHELSAHSTPAAPAAEETEINLRVPLVSANRSLF